jgi:hypothetical protein
MLLAKKTMDKKLFLPVLISVSLVTLLGSVFSIFVLDKYTKKGAIVGDIKKQRILRNETMRIFGEIKNVGKFKINQCKLNIKFINKAFGSSSLTGAAVFKPRGFGDLGKQTKGEKAQVLEENFVAVKSLKPGQKKRFTKYIKYPPYFTKTMFRHKLNCR